MCIHACTLVDIQKQKLYIEQSDIVHTGAENLSVMEIQSFLINNSA